MGLTEYAVQLPRRFNGVGDVACFSEEVAHRRRLPIHVDMSKVVFIKPTGVMATVMFIKTMLTRNRLVSVSFPDDPGVLNYLIQIGMRNVLEEFGTWKWPVGFPEEATVGLRPMVTLRQFESADDVERIVNEMAETFQDSAASNLLNPCHVVFSELADNAITHSGSSGFVLAQRYEYKEGPVIDIAVGDCGVGYRRALWRNRKLRARVGTDGEALVVAMEDGISSLADLYRGYGLGHVNGELSSSGRRLTILSGDAFGSWADGRRRVNTCGPFVGTLVHAFIPC